MTLAQPVIKIRRIDADGEETTTQLLSTPEAGTYDVVLPDGTTRTLLAESTWRPVQPCRNSTSSPARTSPTSPATILCVFPSVAAPDASALVATKR